MELELRHLRLVSAVAEVGSLTRAGDRLHLTQSALSHQLRDIESRLGTPLFLRVGKRLVLTPAGERLLESARDVLDRLDAVERDLKAMGDRARVLRITTECYTCYHWLPPILTRYRRHFAGVEVRIDVDATSRPVEALLEGKIDVAVMCGPDRLDRRLTARPILDDEVVLLVSPGHRLGASRTPVRAADFEGETLFIYPPRSESSVLQDYLIPAGVVPRVEEIKLTEAIVELVKAGLGVSVLAEWAVRPYVRDGSLVVRRIASPEARRRWCAVMLQTTARVDYVKAFVDLVANRAPIDTRAGRRRLRRPAIPA